MSAEPKPMTVQIVVMLMRDREVLLGARPNGSHSLPAAALTPGESLVACTQRITAELGLGLATEICFQRIAQRTGPHESTELHVGMTANASHGSEPAAGWKFWSAVGLPPLAPATAAAIEACRDGVLVTDLGGAPVPARMWPPERAATVSVPSPEVGLSDPEHRAEDSVVSRPACVAADVESLPVDAEPRRYRPPSRLVAGLWFGGAAAWATSVFLALEWVWTTRGPVTTLGWLATVFSAWVICARAGTIDSAPDSAPGGPPPARFAAVLVVGAALCGVLVVAVGLLAGSLPPADAYTLLCASGIATFFVARAVAWRTLENARTRRKRILQRLAWVVMVAASEVALLQVR